MGIVHRPPTEGGLGGLVDAVEELRLDVAKQGRRARGRLAHIAADPSPAEDGQVWIRSDTHQLCWRSGGVTYRLTGVV